MKLYISFFLLTISILTVSCNKNNQRFVFSTDRSNRPITGCLEMGNEAFFGAALAMNCQKSVMDTIFLCSLGRSLVYYTDKSSCEKAYNGTKSTFGEYSLATDPDA